MIISTRTPWRRFAVAMLVMLGLVATSAPGSAQEVRRDNDRMSYDEALGHALDTWVDAARPDPALNQGGLQIINGVDVQAGEFPFLVHLTISVDGNLFECGGSLIGPRKVVTASHCLEENGSVASSVTVRLGSRDFANPEQVILSSAVHVHPAYDTHPNNLLLDDIGIVELSQPANLNSPDIATISLGVLSKSAATIVTAGWGLTDADNPNSLSARAQKATLAIQDCEVAPRDHVCADALGGSAVCSGDSGGPAIEQRNGQNILVGVLAGQVGEQEGFACDDELYTVFQRTAPHGLWIDDPTIEPAKCLNFWATIDLNRNGGSGTGTGADDVILGTPGNDVIEAGSGDDIVCGGDGDDRLFGRQGGDIINGGSGNDVIHGNLGEDFLAGGDGDDRMFGYAANDTLFGQNGNDRMHGNFGNDLLEGGDGNDRIFGYGDDDTMGGGEGDDLLVGNRHNDLIFGDQGNDTLWGSDGQDSVFGGTGNDSVNGNSSNDRLSGGDGDDVLDGGINEDTCDGGAGADVARRCESIVGVP